MCAATDRHPSPPQILPALVHIGAQAPASANEPIVLVLAPTRELAMQSAEVTDKVGAPCKVHCACIYGGAPKGPQYAALRNGAQVVVATPGRLQDLFDEGAVSFRRVTYLTLDEADRMLDLGFEPAIRALAGAVRADRQTLMFSATWPTSIQGLASEFLCSPVMVRIGSDGTRASHSITQVVEVLESEARDGRLEQLLMQYQGGKQARRRCIIFVLYKKEATRVAEWLRRRGWDAREIQGDMPQKQRTETVAAFKAGSLPLLIATDVAARGLDIPGVETVINYSFPLTIEDYVHRIGRTGRAGATGTAHTFFCQQDKCVPALSLRPCATPPPLPSAPARRAHVMNWVYICTSVGWCTPSGVCRWRHFPLDFVILALMPVAPGTCGRAAWCCAPLLHDRAFYSCALRRAGPTLGSWPTCCGRRGTLCRRSSPSSGPTSRRRSPSCMARTSRRWTPPRRARRSPSTTEGDDSVAEEAQCNRKYERHRPTGSSAATEPVGRLLSHVTRDVPFPDPSWRIQSWRSTCVTCITAPSHACPVPVCCGAQVLAQRCPRSCLVVCRRPRTRQALRGHPCGGV